MTFRSAATLPAVLRHALEHPPPTVGVFDRPSRAFALTDLHRALAQAAATATGLADRGVRPGRPVLVAGTGPRQLWLGYLSAVLAGGVPALLPIRPGLDRPHEIQRRLATARRAVPDGLLLVGTTAGGAPCIEPDPGDWTALEEPAEGSTRPAGAAVEELLDRLVPGPDSPLHLQLTSGSTGEAKPVVVTHGNVMANVAALTQRIGLTADDHLVCWLPLYHDLALVGSALASLVAGCHLRLLAPFDFLADPGHWLRALAASPGAVTAAPNFALDLTTRRIDPAVEPILDLSGWRVCLAGAEPVDPGTVRRFVRRFAPWGLGPDVIRPGYGLAEATLVVSLTTGGAPRAVAVTAGPVPATGPIELGPTRSLAGPEGADGPLVTTLGPPLDGIEVAIVDVDTGLPVGERICGEVIVSGPSVSPGYRNPDGTVTAFPHGRCPTGDLGFVHQGELHLVERRSDALILHGVTLSASALEAQLAAGTDLPLDRCVVLQTSAAGEGSRGEIAVVVERARRTTDDALLARVAAACQALPVPVDLILLTPRNALPRTTSGKKQHHELRAGLDDGTIAVVGRIRLGGEARAGKSQAVVIDLDHPPDELVILVEQQARRRGWDGPSVDEHSRLGVDLGFDSLALIELVAEVEAALNLVVPEDALARLDTVGDLRRLAHPDEVGLVEGAGIGAALAQLETGIPQRNRIVQAQRGRRLRIDDRWVVDLASVNYLGLDLDPEVLDAVDPLIRRWGAHPSWTRAVASPAPYRELEEALVGLTGAPDVLAFSSVSLAHFGLLPLLAPRGVTLVVDRTAHRSLQEGAELAAARGAELRWFDHTDPATLEAAFGRRPQRPVVVVDGVYSMTGIVPDLAAIVAVTAAAGGLVYVDDAHGIGVLGRNPDTADPYGRGGGGVLAHLGLGYDHVVYVGGLSKAFSSMGAFVTCRDPDERARFEQASTAIFSGPVPVASLATALAGLEVNARRGDELRRQLHRLTARVIDGAGERGWAVDNLVGFPVVNLVTGGVERTVAACRVMWDHGILFTPSVFPASPLGRGGFRISLTAANTDDDVDRLLAALDALRPLDALPAVGRAGFVHPGRHR